MSQKGLFITFEGGEGAGKTTLIDKILHDLRARSLEAIKTRAPGATHLGEDIRNLLLMKREEVPSPRCELFLFLADRAQHVAQIISPALKKQQIVLCDRYNDSTVAYQGGARELDEKKIRDLCNFACDNLQPRLTLYLDLDPEIGLARVRHDKDRMESEKLSFHSKLREAYHRIAKAEPERFHLLDARKSPQEVFQEAISLIDRLI